MEVEIMKYKKMIVWSGGSEKAKTTKTNAIMYSITCVILCILHITFFTCSPYDDKTIPVTLIDHLLFGGFFSLIFVIFTFGSFIAAKDSFKNIKKNKLITLYLYDIEDFARIGEIPEDKFILFSDKNGVVLAEKEFEDESKTFSFEAKYYHEFEEYYNKQAVEKMEIKSELWGGS